MFTEDQRQRIKRSVRTLQVIVAAMAVGVLVFFGIVVAMPGEAVEPPPLISYVAAAFALVCVAMSWVGPYFITGQVLRLLGLGSAPEGASRFVQDMDDQTLARLLGVYQSRLIVACAPLEGGAFFNLIAYMMEGQTFSLMVAGVLVLLMAMWFPTMGRAEDWIAGVLRAWQ
jgi:hypothetical protein